MVSFIDNHFHWHLGPFDSPLVLLFRHQYGLALRRSRCLQLGPNCGSHDPGHDLENSAHIGARKGICAAISLR